MGKILAVVAAGMVAAGGATYAFFHYADPYCSDHGGCPLARMACCTAETIEACPVSADPAESAVAAAGPVGMFTSPVSAEASCCAAKAKPVARAFACCEAAAGCATADACGAPGLAAVVGPAAAVR